MRNGIGRLWLVAALVAAGCAVVEGLRGGDPAGSDSAVLSVSNGWEVVALAERGAYLDATLRSASEELRFYLRNDETCRRVAVRESRVEYLAFGRLGTLRRGDASCEPIGVASLRAWMRRRPRPRVEPKPRAQATYRLVYEDSEVALARGRFPLAVLADWAGAVDVVAVLPRSEECRAALARGAASMEYGQLAAEPFWLWVESRRCPITGFVKPLATTTDP